MKKLYESTQGTHAYMRMEIDGSIYEIDVYWRETGESYRTTADHDAVLREKVISAFKALY